MVSKELLIAINNGDVEKFYKSKEWLAKRAEILERDNNECQRCKKLGKFEKAECVHHIKHLKDYPELALDDDNLISLSSICHNIEHPEKLANSNTSNRFMNEERWE